MWVVEVEASLYPAAVAHPCCRTQCSIVVLQQHPPLSGPQTNETRDEAAEKEIVFVLVTFGGGRNDKPPKELEKLF